MALGGLSAAAQEAGGGEALDAQLAERIRDSVGAAVALPHGPARVELEVGRLDPRLRLAPCRRIETLLPPAGRLWGRTRIGLRCAEGERHWHVYLPLVVRVWAPALVPRQPLPPGTLLAPQMLTTAEVDWAAETTSPYTDAAPLAGRTLARPVAAGQPLRAADLRQRQWFAAGDTVTISARGDGFVVSGAAQALGAGVEGQLVRVRTESGRVLSGMPVGAQRVEVQL